MKKYSVEEQAKFIAEWEKSGKSRRAFSLERGLKEQTFGKWVNKGPEKGREFVEVSRKREKAAERVPAEPVFGPCLRAGQEMVVERGDIKVRLPLGAGETGLALAIRALR